MAYCIAKQGHVLLQPILLPSKNNELQTNSPPVNSPPILPTIITVINRYQIHEF